MVNKEERIMGIDFGEKRIGIALSDPFHLFAYPFKTLINDSKFWIQIGNIIKEKNVSKILLGLPSASGVSSNVFRNKVEKFKAEIEKKLKIIVIFWDEEFTSSIAKEKVMESVTKKAKRRDKSLIDSLAAAIILQEYLDAQ